MWRTLAALWIGVQLLWFAHAGLGAGFTNDDLMNLHRSVQTPVSRTVTDLVLVFQPSPTFRPLGTLFYRVQWEMFGFSSGPYRVACYLLLGVNVWVLYGFVHELTGSREIALLASLLHGFHGYFRSLYTNTGYCYDLLCFLFYFLSFTQYLRARWISMFVCYLLALNSKEMAVTLPVLILLWELRRRPTDWLWLWPVGAMTLLTAAFISGRIRAATGIIQMRHYQPELSINTYGAHGYHFLQNAFYSWSVLTPAVAVAVVLGLCIFGWWKREQGILIGPGLMLIGVLPVVFIPQRSFDAVYLPAAGLAFALGGVLHWMGDKLRFPAPVTFAALAVFMVRLHEMHSHVGHPLYYAEGRRNVAACQELLPWKRRLEQPGRVLFTGDPFPTDRWRSLFLVHLCYGRMDIEVKRADAEEPGLPERGRFVMRFEGAHILEARPGSD